MNITDKDLKGLWVADRTNTIGTQVIIREATVRDLVCYQRPDSKIPEGLIPPRFKPTILWISITRKRQVEVIAVAFAPLVIFVPNLSFLVVMVLGVFGLFEFERRRMLYVIDRWKRHPQQALADKLVREGKAVAQKSKVMTWRTWQACYLTPSVRRNSTLF